jgi:hypothetical protein
VSGSERRCFTCGAAVPPRSRFCAECGSVFDEDTHETVETTRLDIPPHETGPVPVTRMEAPKRVFGAAPPTTLLVLTLAALGGAVVLLALGQLLVGIVLLAAGGLVAVAFLRVARRLPESPVVRASVDAVGAARARAGSAARAVAATAAGRRRLARLRHERLSADAERDRLLRDLGAATYTGDGAAGEAATAKVRELDELIGAQEAEMTAVQAWMQEQLRHARLEVRRTELLEPPEAPNVPEPYPPPDEADPPQPPQIPEPYPPPGEGDPPEHPEVPEPTPGGLRQTKLQ